MAIYPSRTKGLVNQAHLLKVVVNLISRGLSSEFPCLTLHVINRYWMCFRFLSRSRFGPTQTNSYNNIKQITLTQET